MDKIIDARFERVEKALATLIASISKYNPSPALAQDLVVADQELTDGLSLLSQHQRNTHTIASLHETSTALDAQIRDTIMLLASTRTSLLEIPSSEYPEHTNKVEYEELLNYARRIAKFTVPPEVRPQRKEDADTKDGAQTNGSATPSATVNINGAANGNAMEIDSIIPSNGANPETTTQPQPHSQSSLPEWITGSGDDRVFVPWPRDEELRAGSLATIEALINSGIDPQGWDPAVEEQRAREKAEESERAAEAERLAEEERIKAAEERRMKAMASSSGHHHGAASGGQKPKPFQLEEFDDDDDD